jgi:8-oxo-dGTP diphosphatase
VVPPEEDEFQISAIGNLPVDVAGCQPGIIYSLPVTSVDSVDSKRRIDVVGAAIVRRDNNSGSSDDSPSATAPLLMLCAQRAQKRTYPGMWEFPGGKIEPGETPQQALAREISEELHLTVNVGEKITTTEHEYAEFVARLTTFWCTIADPDAQPVNTEFAALRWLPPAQIHTLDWLPADIPAVHLIQAAHTSE